MSRVILLEFNELTPTLLDGFFERGLLPNFRRFYDESHVYVTDAEEKGMLLNPWVQWVTVHTGLSAAEHGLTELNEGHLLDKPRVWDLASRAGMSSFICGSMNVGHDPDLNGWVVPDPWSTTVDTYPDGSGLEHFYRFVQTQVQEHTNDSVPLGPTQYARFLSFMLSHGMSTETTAAIVKQLAAEKLRSGGRWKRAVLLDKLQFDVFRAIHRKHRPNFSTLFLNSTAHMQHAYWRNMDPDAFEKKPTEDEQREYGGAVLFGYEEMDRLMAQVMELAGSDTTIVFTSGLGQQPFLGMEEEGGRKFYRPRSFEALTEFVGITAKHHCTPVMSEEFQIHFEDSADMDASIPILEGLTMDGREVLTMRRDANGALSTGCKIYHGVDEDAEITTHDGRTGKFFDLFYGAATVKSGSHHPDGVFWVRTPQRGHAVHEGRVSLRSVAPTLLSLLGLKAPAHMTVPAVDVGLEEAAVR